MVLIIGLIDSTRLFLTMAQTRLYPRLFPCLFPWIFTLSFLSKWKHSERPWAFFSKFPKHTMLTLCFCCVGKSGFRKSLVSARVFQLKLTRHVATLCTCIDNHTHTHNRWSGLWWLQILAIASFWPLPFNVLKNIISLKSASLQSTSVNSERFSVKAEQAKRMSLTYSALMTTGLWVKSLTAAVSCFTTCSAHGHEAMLNTVDRR